MKKVVTGLLATAVLVGSAGAMAAATVDPAVSAGITEVSDTVKLYIGLGIAACIGLMVVSLAPEIGITVGKRWIRKGAK